MRTILAVSALALAIASTPAALFAQTMSSPPATQTTTTTTVTDQPSTGVSDPATMQTTMSSTPDAQASANETFAMSGEQKTQYGTWPSAERTKYDAWPVTQQEYFWSLNAEQQKGWWALTDTQRGQIYAMSPAQRAQVWPQITSQVKGPSSASATSASQPRADAAVDAAAMPQNQTYADNTARSSLDNGRMNAAPAGPMASDAPAKTYPLCTRTLQDSCRNPGGR